MTSHLLVSNHVTMVANFEKNSPGFLLNFRRVSSKALRVKAVVGAILIGFLHIFHHTGYHIVHKDFDHVNLCKQL